MKNPLFALAMAACMALTGCSGVSQEKYDALQTKHDNYVYDSDAKIKALQENNDELERLLANANTRAENDYRNYKSIEEKYLDIVNSEEYQWFSRLSDEEIERLMEICNEKDVSSVVTPDQDVSSTPQLTIPTDRESASLAKNEFLNEISSILDFYAVKTCVKTIENDERYCVYYICYDGEDHYVNAYMMLCDVDLQTNIGLIIDAVDETKSLVAKYSELWNCKYYNIYINDHSNNHIVTISKDNLLSNKGVDTVYWHSTVQRELYSQIEQSESLKGYDYRIVGE